FVIHPIAAATNAIIKIRKTIAITVSSPLKRKKYYSTSFMVFLTRFSKASLSNITILSQLRHFILQSAPMRIISHLSLPLGFFFLVCTISPTEYFLAIIIISPLHRIYKYFPSIDKLYPLYIKSLFYFLSKGTLNPPMFHRKSSSHKPDIYTIWGKV